jgi:hypothetical protein
LIITKKLQEAVTSAHETSDQFNQEVIKEFKVFQDSKALELKEILNDLADGNISMYKKSIQDWENMIPFVCTVFFFPSPSYFFVLILMLLFSCLFFGQFERIRVDT